MKIPVAFVMSLVALYFFLRACISYSESSSHKYGKCLNKKLEEILLTHMHGAEMLSFVSKGQVFTIHIEWYKPVPGLKYDTIPKYFCKNVYINNELVCRMHQLDRLFGNTYLAEFSDKRDEYEIVELIGQAYKKAKVFNKDYWKKLTSKHLEKTSFYSEKV